MSSYHTTKVPNFLVIGANKAGTTSLHEYLSQHPEVFMSPNKEPMYFRYGYRDEKLLGEEERFEKNTIYKLEDYLHLFDQAANAKAIGESSTTYLANPECAPRIKDFNPDMKIVVILRNPIERAYSNYKMYINWGIESKSFHRVVMDEIAGRKNKAPQGRQYLQLGKYSDSLATYIRHFGKKQVKVFLYEEMKNIDLLLRELFLFVGVDESVKIDTSKKLNVSRNLSYQLLIRKAQRRLSSFPIAGKLALNIMPPKLDTKSRKILLGYYAEDITRLGQLIDQDVSHWLS